jgi:5,10-methylenetetrahydromethanopterin reductase
MAGVSTSRFGMRIPPCAPLPDIAECVRQTEAAGYGTAWLPDSQFLFRDAWMALAASSALTDQIRLAIGVTNFRTRHSSVTASALQTLEETASGRAIVGVGTGDSSVKTLGWHPSRLTDLEVGVQEIRRLSSGQLVDFGDGVARLNGATGRMPPLFLAATGPRALQLAGQIADGVLVMAGVTPSLISQAVQHVEKGLASAGRSREDIEVCVGAVCYVADSDTDVVRIAKPHCVGDAQRGALTAFEQSGVRLRAAVPATIPGVYPDITHADDWDTAVGVAGQWVDDKAAKRYAEQFTFIATPDDMIARLQAAIGAGADSFYLRHFQSYVLPHDLIDMFGTRILPHFITSGDFPAIRRPSVRDTISKTRDSIRACPRIE